jgi:hypothetical protein
MTLTRRPSPFDELLTLRRAMARQVDDAVLVPLSGHPGAGHAAKA